MPFKWPLCKTRISILHFVDETLEEFNRHFQPKVDSQRIPNQCNRSPVLRQVIDDPGSTQFGPSKISYIKCWQAFILKAALSCFAMQQPRRQYSQPQSYLSPFPPTYQFTLQLSSLSQSSNCYSDAEQGIASR